MTDATPIQSALRGEPQPPTDLDLEWITLVMQDYVQTLPQGAKQPTADKANAFQNRFRALIAADKRLAEEAARVDTLKTVAEDMQVKIDVLRDGLKKAQSVAAPTPAPIGRMSYRDNETFRDAVNDMSVEDLNTARAHAESLIDLASPAERVKEEGPISSATEVGELSPRGDEVWCIEVEGVDLRTRATFKGWVTFDDGQPTVPTEAHGSDDITYSKGFDEKAAAEACVSELSAHYLNNTNNLLNVAYARSIAVNSFKLVKRPLVVLRRPTHPTEVDKIIEANKTIEAEDKLEDPNGDLDRKLTISVQNKLQHDGLIYVLNPDQYTFTVDSSAFFVDDELYHSGSHDDLRSDLVDSIKEVIKLKRRTGKLYGVRVIYTKSRTQFLIYAELKFFADTPSEAEDDKPEEALSAEPKS